MANPPPCCAASREFLAAHAVQPWVDLPVWIPGVGDTAGAHRRSTARAIAAGLRFAAADGNGRRHAGMVATVAESRQNAFPAGKFGLSPAREQELLGVLATGRL